MAVATVPAIPAGIESEREREVARWVREGHLAFTVASGSDRWYLGARAVSGLPWIRSIRLTLAPHSRGTVNAYVVDTSEGPVLVDTGFHTTAERLVHSLRVTGIEQGSLSGVMVTHGHADHIGASRLLKEQGWCRPDGEVVIGDATQSYRGGFDDLVELEEHLRRHGVPDYVRSEWLRDLGTMSRLAAWPDADRLMVDGEEMTRGDTTFRFVFTPGHSPDHFTVIAEREGERAVFLGDLVSGTGMPPVGVRDLRRVDPVADLETSWDLLVGLQARGGLPGHGEVIADLENARAGVLADRARRLELLVATFGGRSVTAAEATAELAAQAAVPWSQFDFYSTLALLRHLELMGRARSEGGAQVHFTVGRP